jgi:hypothetical protein
MSKRIVTAIGLIVSLGVIALAVFLVASPLYVQAVAVDAQTATVAQSNSVYQAQVDSLHQQKQNIDQINASVTALRSQIPSTGKLDDVFEVVGHAASASGVALTTVTAGDQVVFVARTAATDEQATVPAPAPAPTPAPSSTQAADAPATPAPDAGSGGTAAASGRQQVDFAIQASAVDMAQATAFLDALRAGPRLLSSITASTTQSGEGTVDIQVSALTYVDAKGD